MSDASILFRDPTGGERRLIEALFQRAPELEVASDYMARVKVRPLNDGGMGSFRISEDPAKPIHHVLADVAATLEFRDADGVLVSATLNVDTSGIPFEVDVWKTDFAPLVRVPHDLLG